jgi:hypothetical protein
MITHQEIKNLVTEWGLRESIIEKDYIIGWVLWGVGSDPEDSPSNHTAGYIPSIKKCELKGVFMPTLESIQNALTKGELISEWENMLRHQLQALPPFDKFWDELPNIFNWLEGK